MDRSSEERSRTWTPLVEVIRREMLARFSDKLSMEEIASCAYAVAAPLFTPTAEDSRVAEALRDVLAICESRASEFWEAYIRTILRRISILSGVPSEATPNKENAPPADEPCAYNYGHGSLCRVQRRNHNTMRAHGNSHDWTAPIPEGVQGKEPQTYEQWLKTVPRCIGGESGGEGDLGCDGDLVGTAHEEDCPMHRVPDSAGRNFGAGLQDAFAAGQVSGGAAGRRSAITELQGWMKNCCDLQNAEALMILAKCSELQEKTKP